LKPTRSGDIARIYLQACAQGQAFALFRLPNGKKISHIVGTASHHLKDGESAFAFAPFDPTQKPYYIKANWDISKTDHKSHNEDLNHHVFKPPLGLGGLKSTSKKQFTDLVKKIKARIKSGEFKKIVAARVLAIEKPHSFDPVMFFEKLCVKYRSAFVSLVYIPGVGLWIGASPEVLVSETSTRLTTYSLAGTKVMNDNTDWHSKEIEEQRIVTDFIHQKLGETVEDKISLKGPVTKDAGTVKHLLSVFTIQHNGRSVWKQVVKALHPTPAVAGMPQHSAVHFVLENESFDRAFYAGYLGRVSYNKRTDLFVNLRCMQVTEKQLLFYAGCGVTADSDAEKEWQESERKIDVIKGLI